MVFSPTLYRPLAHGQTRGPVLLRRPSMWTVHCSTEQRRESAALPPETSVSLRGRRHLGHARPRLRGAKARVVTPHSRLRLRRPRYLPLTRPALRPSPPRRRCRRHRSPPAGAQRTPACDNKQAPPHRLAKTLLPWKRCDQNDTARGSARHTCSNKKE